MSVNNVTFSDIENLQTGGATAASLVNDLKRAVNQMLLTGGVTETVPVALGGTGGTTAATARTNLEAAHDVEATISLKGLMSASDKNLLVSLSSLLPTTGALPVTYSATRIYGTAAAPLTAAAITESLTSASVGRVQKIYHQAASQPSYPAGWVKLGGEYVNDVVNRIYAEFAGGTIVEYWIVQEI